MWRLIFLGLIIYLLIVFFKRSTIGAKNDNKNVKKDVPASEKEIEAMVKCATCEVHLPRSEAYLVNGDFYCSKLHIPK
ncbi:PP0621 family protein [Methylotenera sp.]|nr:PP0621 family protein [Methylotenera sp.]MDO9204866.1 PP0621 family protein [Methylotenera sp.]MDO9392517.1 PP0621 family protein [Methylotenera sp.]MDP1523839.1 PP0621 family protein [Methylotenera sp.]MDP2070229.1 PP0621 family protein [Methylotenera sp.]MDP2231932.1 PP0621 family protein [Methylotenera sp.]